MDYMIKLFSDTSPQSLEQTVNRWINEAGTIEIINMSYTIENVPHLKYHLALNYNQVIVDW